VKGFCPSFVTAEGAQVKKPKAQGGKAGVDFSALPQPKLPEISRPYGVVVTGVGGTGVVTIGNLIGMAAHIEHKGVTVLDMTGLAQKGGAVLSHVQISASPEQIHATRIATGEADLIIGCDVLVSASNEVLSKTQFNQTRAVINSANNPTADFVRNPNWRFPGASSEQDIKNSVGEACEFFDAQQAAVKLLGDAIYSNPLVMGYAWQKGWMPLSYVALMRAIELNGVSVEKNQQAFEWGRYLAHHGAGVLDTLLSSAKAKPALLPETLDGLIRQRVDLLTAYQDSAYARRYEEAVERVRQAEQRVAAGGKLALTEAVAKNLAKLMAYKDEYEVARLYSDPAYLDKLRAQFEGEPGKDYQLHFHLAPPLLSQKDDKGHLVKKKYGPWVLSAFKLLAKCKGLRGTAWDVFGHTEERKMERQLIADYFALVDLLCSTLNADNHAKAVELAQVADTIRGFGHVKEGNVAKAKQRWAELESQYRLAARATATA
jgi:indolepyruvate ferredoxin oxidoreductase